MKTYKLGINEKRDYHHTMKIQVPDDADIDKICDDLEKAINNNMCDLWAVCCVNGINPVEVIEDEGPDCECEIEEYDEVTEDAEDTEEAEEE